MWVIVILFLVWGLGSLLVGILLPGELGGFGIIVGIFWLVAAAGLTYKFRDVGGKRGSSATSSRESIVSWFDTEEGEAEFARSRMLAERLKWLPVAAGLMMTAIFTAELAREMQILLNVQAPQAGIILNFLIMTGLLLFPSALVIVIGLKRDFWVTWFFSFWFLLLGFEALTFHFGFTGSASLLTAAVLFLLPFIHKALQ